MAPHQVGLRKAVEQHDRRAGAGRPPCAATRLGDGHGQLFEGHATQREPRRSATDQQRWAAWSFVCWDRSRRVAQGERIALKGPMHRTLLARLIVARGEVVSVDRLVDDLWPAPPPRAVGAIRTFVADLRQALEPGRPPRAPARLLVTEGHGYALRTDGRRRVALRGRRRARRRPPGRATPRRPSTEALGLWRGPAYAELADHHWTRPERARLTELRLLAVERRAEARLALGGAAAGRSPSSTPTSPSTRGGRTAGACSPSPSTAASARPTRSARCAARARCWSSSSASTPVPPSSGSSATSSTTTHSRRSSGSGRAPPRPTPARSAPAARLESTVALLRDVAVRRRPRGGAPPPARRDHRRRGARRRRADGARDRRLRRPRDLDALGRPRAGGGIVAAAERTLPHVAHDGARARLLATIALESRGTRRPASAGARGRGASPAASTTPRCSRSPSTASSCRAATRSATRRARDAIGEELIALATRHDLRHLRGPRPPDPHPGPLRAGRLRDRRRPRRGRRRARPHDRPLIGVFTAWYRALRSAATGGDAERAYRDAARTLDGAGMPGLDGLPALAQLSLGQTSRRRPIRGLGARPAPRPAPGGALVRVRRSRARGG